MLHGLPHKALNRCRNTAMHEYKVVPAPLRAEKSRGLKTTADRFANTLAERINAEAAGGWQFVRTETLPCEERRRWGANRATTQVVMIFARELGQTRPDAGAALAAAQGNVQEYQSGHDAAPAQPQAPEYYAPRHSEPDAQAPLHSHQPEPVVPPPPPARRQEPLFRSGAILRAEGAGRAEPVLRPRAPPADAE